MYLARGFSVSETISTSSKTKVVSQFVNITEVQMKRLVVLIFFLLSSCASVWAQSSSKGELFAGYSFESINSGISSTNAGTTTSLDNQFKLNGFNASAASYFRKHFGIAGDFSAHFDNRNDTLGPLRRNQRLRFTTLPADHSSNSRAPDD